MVQDAHAERGAPAVRRWDQ